MAGAYRPGFPARLERLQAVRLGTRRVAAADQELSRLVRPYEGRKRAGRWGARQHVAADDAGRCARHHGPDGTEATKPSKDRELIDKQALVRQGHLRQEFRDHDSPARRPAQQLSAHRRQAPAGAGRRSRHAPAARVQFADRHALRLRQSEDRRDAAASRAIRRRSVRCSSSSARSANSRASRFTTTRPSARCSRFTIAARRSGWWAPASTSRPASGSIRRATSAAASIPITSIC